MNPYIFNLMNGILLCVLGFWSNSLNFEYAIYFILLGVVLIGLTYFVNKSHKVLGSMAMMSTILSSLVLGYLLYNSFGTNTMMSTPIGMMFIFFPIGLWFVQPKLNRLMLEDNEEMDTEFEI